MAFAYTNSKGRTYYLHAKDVELRGGRQQTIYFFSKEVKDGALHVLPSGKIVVENGKTGLPILKGSEKKTNIGNSDVLTSEKVKVSEPVNIQQEPQVSKGTLNVEKTIESNKPQVENTVPEPKVEQPNVSKSNKTKVNPWTLVMLPGQLLVVGTVNLLMYAWSKSPEKVENE